MPPSRPPTNSVRHEGLLADARTHTERICVCVCVRVRPHGTHIYDDDDDTYTVLVFSSSFWYHCSYPYFFILRKSTQGCMVGGGATEIQPLKSA